MKTSEELTQQLFNELKKEFVKDILKIMDSTCPEYLTSEGKGFLDGLSASGECVEYVTKDKYNIILERSETIQRNITYKNSQLEKEIIKLKQTINELKRPSNKKGFFN